LFDVLLRRLSILLPLVEVLLELSDLVLEALDLLLLGAFGTLRLLASNLTNENSL